MDDPRSYSDGPMQNCLEGFLELLENSKKEKNDN